MKKIDDTGIALCKFTSALFEYSTKIGECSSKVFIKAHVYSSIQKRLSSASFLYESIDIVSAYNTIKAGIKLTRGKDIYPSYVMAWIRYIMKYFSYTTGISEEVLYKKLKPEDFYHLYESYHSLDNELVVKRIAEANEININLNNIELMKSLTK
jgi:hypothetical protein